MPAGDLAWLAALIEGEGYIGVVRGRGTIRLVMTDADIISRAHVLSGIGTIYELPQRAEHHKTAYSWTVVREASVPGLLVAVTPLLASRRRAQAAKVMGLYDISLPDACSLTPGSDSAWSWVAGLIEGEGFFQPGPFTKRRNPQVCVDSTDRDVVERLTVLTGSGTLLDLGSRRMGWKARYRWCVAKKSEVRTVLSLSMSLLGTRRAEQASYVLQHA
jgi:hypothetical protein